ncbi:MAG: helix-turn-helix transcriptional regulator [Mycobacterium sp.]
MRIRDLREAHGLSIPALAARIAAEGVVVHPDTISNVELGHKRPSHPLMTAWAKALDVHPLDVVVPEPKQRQQVA